jgi:hypothetical protein
MRMLGDGFDSCTEVSKLGRKRQPWTTKFSRRGDHERHGMDYSIFACLKEYPLSSPREFCCIELPYSGGSSGLSRIIYHVHIVTCLGEDHNSGVTVIAGKFLREPMIHDHTKNRIASW